MASRNRNETYNTTYNLKTLADFTSLINGFKEVLKTLSAKASLSDILGIEKSIERLQELLTKATNIANRGFTSNKDIKLYNSIMNALVTRADALNAKLSNLHFKNLDNELKNAKRDLRLVLTELNSILRTTEKSIATSLKGIKGNKEYAKLFIEAADNEQERLKIEQKITKEINDLIKALKKSKKETENSLPQYSALNDPYTMAASPYYGSQLTMKRISYTDIKGNKLNDNLLAQIEKEYKRIVETSSSATTAVRNFKAKLEEMYIVIESRGKHIKKPSDTIKEAFSDSFKIKEKVLDSDAIKEEITTISNNIDLLTSKREELKTLFASEEFVNSLNAIATAQENVTTETERLALAEKNAGNTELPEKIKQLNEELDRLDNEATDANLELEGFKLSLETINNFTNSLQNSVKQVLSITTSWHLFRQMVSQTYNDVKELDKSFAQIAMVTNYEVSDLWGRYEEYAQLANKLGQSTQSVVEASGLYYQQGLDTVEVMELTEQTMKLATLAGLDFKEATAQMTAAIRGFHMEMSEGQRVTDVYAEVAAHAAVDVKGLSDAMSATASIANSAGMLFETTTAMLATMAEVTLEAPKNLGTALKTVIARFTELKENVAGTADSEFEDLDYNKVDKALKTVGVLLKDTTGLFRNLDDVFLDLGKKWNTLDRNSLRYIATIAAGSRQQSRFIALMENYDRTMELVDVALNSAGKSLQLFAKFSDSVEYKVNKLKNTWEQFRINLVDSSAYGKAIDFVTTIAEKFENIDLSKLLTLAPMILVLGRTMGKLWVTGFSKSITSEKGLINRAITAITKSKDGKTKVNIEADISDYKKILEEAQLEKKKADLILSEPFKLEVSSQDVQNELSTAQLNLKQLKTLAELNLKSGNFIDDLTDKIQEAENKIVELEQKLRETLYIEESQKNAKAKSDVAQKVIDEAETGLKESEKSLKRSSVMRAVGTAVGESIATAITMSMTGNFDWSEIFLTTAIESAISGISTLLSGDIAAGISLIAVAGISWIGSYIADNIEEANEKLLLSLNKVYALEKLIENLTEALEVFNEKLDEANLKYDELKSHWDAVKEASETYKELKTRVALTEEQEELLQTALNTLIEECPELVTRYDAAGQAIIDLGNNFDTVIEKQRQLFNEAAIELNNAEMTSQMVSVAIADAEVKKAKELLKDLKNIYDSFYVANGSGNGEKISAKKLFELERGRFEEGLEKEEQKLNDSTTYMERDKEQLKDNVKDYEKVLKKFDDTLKLHNNNYHEAIEDLKATTDYIDEQYKSGNEIFDLTTFDEPAFDDINDAEDYMRTMLKLNSTAKDVFIDILKELKEEGTIEKIDEDVVKDILNLNKKTANELIDIIDDAGGKDDEKIWEKVREKFLDKTTIKDAESELKAAQAQAEAVLQDQTLQMMNTIADGIQVKLMDNANGNISISDELAVHMLESIEKWITNSSAVKTELKAIQDKLNGDLKDLSDDPEEQEQAIEQARKDTEAALKKAEDSFWNLEGILNIVKLFDDLTELLELQVLLYYDDLGKVTLQASRDTIELLEKAGVGEEVLKAMEANRGALEEEVTLAQAEISQLMGTSISPSYGAGLAYKENTTPIFKTTNLGQIFDEAVPEILLSLSDALKNALGDDSTDEAKSYFIKHLNGFLADVGEGVDATVLTRLLTEEWDDVSFLNLEEKAEEFGHEFEESFGGEFEEGILLYKDFIVELNQSSDLIDLSISGPAIDEYTEKFSELLSNTISKFSGLSSVILNQLKNGFISFSESLSLKEACSELKLKAENYLTYLADGSIIFDAKAFEEAVEGTITNEEEIVAQIKQQTKELIELLELLLALIKGDEAEVAIIVDKAKKLKAFNKQLKVLVEYLKALGRIDETALKNISDDEDISDYKLNKDVALVEKNLEEKLTNRQTLLQDLEAGNYGDLLNLLDIAAAGRKEIRDTYNSAVESALGSVETLEKAVTDAQKSVDDAHEKVVSALKDVLEAEEKVVEQTEKLNEALYGTDNYKNKSDNLYNYTTMLERLQKAADDAKNALDDISEGDDVQANVNTYLQKARDEAIARQAENEVIRLSILNYQNVLNDRLGQEIANMNSQYGADMDINISDFYYKKGDRWAINFQALNAANIPDEISDYVEETVALMNKLEDSIEDNAETIKKREKEIRELRKKGVLAEITLENEVADVLKEKYQEEVDNLKDKYKSMEEADNEYVDALKEAIDKQRLLRSRQNEWENLATKEKKLSLLSRDTSGANRLTTQRLQKEILSDREKLLDNTIDSIINNLKELYETQKETRDSEIEYQEALLENTNFIKEANTIIQSWESADDAISFFYKNVKNISEMSEALLEQETESWKDMYEAHTLYLATNTKNFNDTLQHFEDGAEATNEEILEIIKETSETLTNEATRSLNEISSKTSEAIKSALDAVTDALDTLAEKLKTYNEALESERLAVVSLALAQKELNEARDAYKEALGLIDNLPTPSSSIVQLSTGLDITELGTMLRGTLIGAINRATDSSGVHVENIKWDKVIKDFNSSYNADFLMEDLLTILKDTKYHGVYAKNDKTIKFLSLDEGKATSYLESYPANERTKYLKFKTGGLVDYTGPAWVDGSPTKPEAFLNPEDTERIGKAAELLSHLSDLLNFNTSPTENITNNSIVGDTTINVTVNVENISDDYDVDLAIERIKQEIVDAAAFTGANVILKQ